MYDPDRSGESYSAVEVVAAQDRPVPTPVPAPGERVLYRHDAHGDITDALVVEVRVDPRDPNVHVTGEPWRIRADPWPDLILSTAWGLVQTKEARVRGSAGWLPANWEGAS